MKVWDKSHLTVVNPTMGKKVIEYNFLLSSVASIFLNWICKGKEKAGLRCKEQVNATMGKKVIECNFLLSPVASIFLNWIW